MALHLWSYKLGWRKSIFSNKKEKKKNTRVIRYCKMLRPFSGSMNLIMSTPLVEQVLHTLLMKHKVTSETILIGVR